jgi:hypothetical protein
MIMLIIVCIFKFLQNPMKNIIFYCVNFILLQSCNNQTGDTSLKEGSKIDQVSPVGNYVSASVTRKYFEDGTVYATSPFGNETYQWIILEKNLDFTKIQETQGEIKVIFFLYNESSKYPRKVKSCLSKSSLLMKQNYSGKLLISEYGLNSEESCGGIYFKE